MFIRIKIGLILNMDFQGIKDIVKQRLLKLQEYLSEFLIQYMIVESVRENLIQSRLDKLAQEKKLVVSLLKEK